MKYVFKTIDHPEADGRQMVQGDLNYELKFPLQDQGELILLCGHKMIEKMAVFIDACRERGIL
jgi:hypothetical protein